MRRCYRRLAALTVTALLLALAPVAGAAGTPETDSAKPRVSFSTGDRAILVGAVAGSEWTELRGTATDLGGSGVGAVSLTYCANAWKSDHGMGCGSSPVPTVGALFVRDASVVCAGAHRRRCTWAAPAPQQPGQYLVVATATDASGNRRSTRPLFITVV
jgi:hypothetical protein